MRQPHPDGIAGSPALFALPWLVGLCGLTLLPMTASLFLSLARWDGLTFVGGVEWVGLANYQDILTGADGRPDPIFVRAITNSLVYTALAVPLGVLTSLAAALLLNAPVRAAAVFRTVFMLPYMLGGVATVMVWSWMFNPQFGPVNHALRFVYAILDPLVRVFDAAGTGDWTTPDWFYSPAACKPALVLMHVWLGGGAMMVFFAALRRVPRDLLDAARIDGAGAWRRLRHVTVPVISPVILFNTIVGVIFSMQAFDPAYLLHNRAQRDGLLFYMLHVYRTAFEAPHRMGYASALSWILFAATALIVLMLALAARRRVFNFVRE